VRRGPAPLPTMSVALTRRFSNEGIPFRSAPRASRYSAIRRCPPWHACQNASVLLRRWRARGEKRLHAGRQTQRRCLPQPVDSGTALNQQASDLPTPVSDRVLQWCAARDRCAWRLDLRAGVDQRPGHLHIVAARRPVQCRLGGAAPLDRGVGVGASADQCGHHRRSVGEIARPVGRATA
jgi:hypothetical protein